MERYDGKTRMDARLKRIMACILAILLLAGCAGETPSAQEGEVLVMACWSASSELLSLVEQYNGTHPELQITVREFQNESIDVDDAITRMNTELVADAQVDLFCFGNMNLQSLIHAGLVADLSPYVDGDPDMNDENYFMDILSMFEQGGKLYEIPSYVQLAGICLPDSVVPEGMTGWTIDEYLAFDEELAASGKTVLSMDPEGMLAFMIQYGMKEFVNVTSEQCNFQTEGFYKLLEFVKEHAAGNGGEPVGYDCWIMGVWDYAGAIADMHGQPVYLGFPDAARDGPCAWAVNSYGIASTTAHPDECWEFLKMMLSDEVFFRLNLDKQGFPLSRSALETAIERYSLSTGDEGSPVYGLTDENGDAYIPLEAQYVPYLYTLLDSVTHARFRYDGVFAIVGEEGAAFFAEDKSAEKVAEVIQNRVTIFLNEQN